MIKSIRTFIKYRQTIDNSKFDLLSKYNVKIDKLYRLGSRVSIPINRFSVLKEYKHSELDIFNSLNDEVKRKIGELDQFFISKNLIELVGIYSVERVDENLVTLIISYRLFNVVKFAMVMRFILIFSFLSLSLGYFNPYYMIISTILIFGSILTNKVIFKKLFI